MTIRGYREPLYILPFDHRGSFETGMFGWKGDLTQEQTAQIAAAKQVIYEGFKEAIAGGVPKEKAGILVAVSYTHLPDARENHAFCASLVWRHTRKRRNTVVGLFGSRLHSAPI